LHSRSSVLKAKKPPLIHSLKALVWEKNCSSTRSISMAFPGLRTNRRRCRHQAPFQRYFLVLNNRWKNPLTAGIPGFNLGRPSFR
ncbi:hypothetical protein LINPERHAP1_LOCUS5033, partial [Linum perenne]